jgi:hypothetical protein
MPIRLHLDPTSRRIVAASPDVPEVVRVPLGV